MEKAVAWVRSLEARSFIGTESRLNAVFELLRQMKFEAESDPEARLEELKRRRLELDEEIARVDHGEVSVLDRAGLRDRYQQVTATAHELLADFREVEANFRDLDRELRQRIAVWDGAKGELLDDVQVFPNDAAVERLATAVLIELHDEWIAFPRRYLSNESMDSLYPDKPTLLPATDE